MRISTSIYFFAISVFLGCSSHHSNENDFIHLTRFVDMMDVNNRTEFLHIAFEYYDNNDEMETGSLQMFYILDSAYSEILISSGGYDIDGNMAFGHRKGLADGILKNQETIAKIKSIYNYLNENYRNDSINVAKLDHITNAIYPLIKIDESNKFHEMTVAQVLMYIMIAENKLLQTVLI